LSGRPMTKLPLSARTVSHVDVESGIATIVDDLKP
jgi:hypothetical protein